MLEPAVACTSDPPSWGSILAACQHIADITNATSLRRDDVRLTGRFVRKVAGVLTSITDENPGQAYSDVDSSGLLHHTLRCCIDLTTRCRTVGRLEAYLEAAALRSEFKTVAGDLRMGLDRLETDHVHVPVDVADDVAVLSGQLAAVEFSVASDQEVAAAEIHRTVLLERLGLAHDHQILGLIKGVLKHCGLADAPSHVLTHEASGLRRRAAEAHELHDHVHELVLHKVADIITTCICPMEAAAGREAAASLDGQHSLVATEATSDVSAAQDALEPQAPPCAAGGGGHAHGHVPSSSSSSLRSLHLVPPRPPVAPADPCPPERKPSLIRRLSCGGSMALLSPTNAGGCAASSTASVVIGGNKAGTNPTGINPATVCNGVMLCSVSNQSLASSTTSTTIVASRGGSIINGGHAAGVAHGDEDGACVCEVVSAADDFDADPCDLLGLVQALHSDNTIIMELAAVCLLHACCSNNSNVDWSALEGTRMRLIRPLLNILRHRHPLSLKVTAAHVLQRLARSQESRALIAESGALLLLLRLLRSPYDPAKQAAARAITNVAYGNSAVKAELVKAGILDVLNIMMEGLHPLNQEAAALAAANLACSPDSAKTLVDAGTLRVLIHVLRDGNAAGRTAAARALRNIVHHHPPAKMLALDQGAVPLLLEVMTHGQGAARHTAVTALGSVAARNDRMHTCVVMEGMVITLVNMLTDTHVSIAEAAATTLAALCTTNDVRHAVAAAGGVEGLTCVLKLRASGGGDDAQVHAARAAGAAAMRALVSCEIHAVKQSVAASGAVNHLAAMLGGADGEAAQKAAAGALWNLAYKNEHNRNIIREAGAIPLLVRLLKSYQPESMRREAARAISNLSCNNHANQVAIAASGAIPPLVHLLQSGSPCSVEAAARALSNLALQDENQADIAAAGAVPALLQHMAGGSEACQEAAVRAYGNVIVNNHHAAVSATATRAIPLLKELLGSEGKRSLQLEAARALGNLACLGSSTQAAIVGSGVVGMLVRMLDSGHDGTRESAACTLWDIAYDNDVARRAIVAGNGVPYLVQALLFGGAGTKEASASTLMELACLGQRSNTTSPSSHAPSATTTPRRGADRTPNTANTRQVHEEVLSPTQRGIGGRHMVTQVQRGSDQEASSASDVSSNPGHSREVSDDGGERGNSSKYASAPASGRPDDGDGGDDVASVINNTKDTAMKHDTLEQQLTGRGVRAAIIDAGAMPLLIQLAGSGDVKLRAVGRRALEVMGYSSDVEQVEGAVFPRVSAYHQPQLVQPQLLAARF